MKLTNYRKFMVEKYNSFDPPISKQEFCSNHSREKITVEDFGIWINLYDEYKSKGDKPKSRSKTKRLSSKKKLGANVKPFKIELTSEEKKKRRIKALQLKQIKRYRSIVLSEKYLFSKDKFQHSYRFNMFFNEAHQSQIYRLALYLAKDLNRVETNLEYFKKEVVTSQNQINKLKDELASVKESLDFELERHPSQIVFEIDPSKHNQIMIKEKSKEKEELSYLCESSINNLKASLAGVYKILGGLQI